MASIKRIYLLVLLSCLHLGALMAGGPWASPRLGGYFELGSTFTLATVTDNTHQLYSEFGLSKRISLKAILPFRQVSTPKDITDISNNTIKEGELSGIGNIIIGLKYQLLVDLPVSIGLDLSLNTLDKKEEVGLRTGYEGYTIRPILAIGNSKGADYYFAEIQPGFTTNNYSGDLTLVGEYGSKIAEKIYLALYTQARLAFSNGTFNASDAASFQKVGFYIDRQQYVTIGPKAAIVMSDKWGISLALFYTRGRAQAGSVYSTKLGLYYNLPGKN